MSRFYRELTRIGNVGASNEFDQLWDPETIRGADKYGAVVLHGANSSGLSTGFDWENTAWPSTSHLVAVLARAGIPVIGAHMGGNHHSIDATITKITTAINYLAAQTGCSSAKAHLIGLSMGGGTAVRYAGLNPGRVASIHSIIGTASLDRAHRENNGMPNLNGFTSSIATAWGLSNRRVTDAVVSSGSDLMDSEAANFTVADVNRVVARGVSQTAIPLDTTIVEFIDENTVRLSKNATANATAQDITISDPLPMSGTPSADLIGDFAPVVSSNNIPAWFGYATNDPFVLSADVLSIAAAANGTPVNLGATGHTNAAAAAFASYQGTNWSGLLNRLLANGA